MKVYNLAMIRLALVLLLLVPLYEAENEDSFLLDSLLKAVNIKIHEYEMNSIKISAIENQIIQLFCPGNASAEDIIWSFNGKVLSKGNLNWRKFITKRSIFLFSVQIDLDEGVYECYDKTILLGQVDLEIESSIHAVFSGLLYSIILSSIGGFIYFFFFLKMNEIKSFNNFSNEVMYG